MFGAVSGTDADGNEVGAAFGEAPHRARMRVGSTVVGVAQVGVGVELDNGDVGEIIGKCGCVDERRREGVFATYCDEKVVGVVEGLCGSLDARKVGRGLFVSLGGEGIGPVVGKGIEVEIEFFIPKFDLG